jgi:hypothetical protein
VKVEGALRDWNVEAADREFVRVSKHDAGQVEFVVKIKDRLEPAFPDEPFEPAAKKK